MLVCFVLTAFLAMLVRAASLINALAGRKLLSVSITPGHTKVSFEAQTSTCSEQAGKRKQPCSLLVAALCLLL